MFKGRRIRFHLLERGVSKNLWTCFETAAAPVSQSCRDALKITQFAPRVVSIRGKGAGGLSLLAEHHWIPAAGGGWGFSFQAPEGGAREQLFEEKAGADCEE